MLIDTVAILDKESIYVGHDLKDFIAQKAIELAPVSCFAFISDHNVAPLHLESLVNAFKNALLQSMKDVRILTYSIQAGECYKTRATKESVEDYLLSHNCTRDTCIIALGGGVVGDLAGI